jgi:hypothetical protein
MEYDGNIKEGIDQVLVIAKERAEILERLRQALVNDELQKIKLYAAKLCGIDHESG